MFYQIGKDFSTCLNAVIHWGPIYYGRAHELATYSTWAGPGLQCQGVSCNGLAVGRTSEGGNAGGVLSTVEVVAQTSMEAAHTCLSFVKAVAYSKMLLTFAGDHCRSGDL